MLVGNGDLEYQSRLGIARLRADLHWISNAAERRRITARMDLALKGTDLPHRPRTLARQTLEHRAMSDSLLPRPNFWKRVNVDVEKFEKVRADNPGRGFVLTSVHSPTMWLSAATASGVFGYDIMWAVNDDIFRTGEVKEDETREGIGGSTLIRAKDTYLMMRERLREAGMVGLLFDVPGPVRVPLMGKQASVHPWFAKLAKYQNALIVPCLGIWTGSTMTLEIGDVVDAAASGDVTQICARTAAAIDVLWQKGPSDWAPYTGVLWPDDVGPYRWAFDDAPVEAD